MGEHAGFIAHLLDPTERELVAKAMKANEAFLKMHAHPVPTSKAVRAVEDILDDKPFQLLVGPWRQAIGMRADYRQDILAALLESLAYPRW